MANPMYGQNKNDDALNNGTLDYEVLSGAGACSITTPVTFLDSGGAVAITLAASSVPGQVKHIIMSKAGGTATLTIADAVAVGNTVAFAAVGDAISLINAADEDGIPIGWCLMSRESGLANIATAFDGPVVTTV